MTGPSLGSNAPVRLALAVPILVALGSGFYLAVMILDMSVIPGMNVLMMQPQTLGGLQFFGLLLMWAVMMAAMMLPTALPMISAYARMQSVDRRTGASALPVAMFSGGYVLAWAGFSVAAAGLQAWLTAQSLLSPMMMKVQSEALAGAIILAAGIYQFTPLKQRCLRQCQSPLSFLMTKWRPGALGALSMGTRHGAYCVGCCWALMGVLFVAGVMSAVWIVAITAYVLMEKLAPTSTYLSRLVGAGLTFAGLALIF